MTQPDLPGKNAAFSAEKTTAKAILDAVKAAIAAWLGKSAALILPGRIPNLGMLVDGAEFVKDATRRIGEALQDAWLTVFARTGTDLRPYIADYLIGLAGRLTGLAPLAARRTERALAEAMAATIEMDKIRAAVAEWLSPGRYDGYAERVAATEANIAVNSARHAQAIELSATRRVEKTWHTRQDAAVRQTHRHAQGQTVPLNVPFWVGGIPMQHPGDPSAPPEETANCRCVVVYAFGGRT